MKKNVLVPLALAVMVSVFMIGVLRLGFGLPKSMQVVKTDCVCDMVSCIMIRGGE